VVRPIAQGRRSTPRSAPAACLHEITGMICPKHKSVLCVAVGDKIYTRTRSSCHKSTTQQLRMLSDRRVFTNTHRQTWPVRAASRSRHNVLAPTKISLTIGLARRRGSSQNKAVATGLQRQCTRSFLPMRRPLTRKSRFTLHGAGPTRSMTRPIRGRLWSCNSFISFYNAPWASKSIWSCDHSAQAPRPNETGPEWRSAHRALRAGAQFNLPSNTSSWMPGWYGLAHIGSNSTTSLRRS